MRASEDVAIFWDYENCPAPSSTSGHALANNIRSIGQIFGSIKSFKAYLEVSDQVPPSRTLSLRSELQCSGVSLIDCPHNGRKDVADKMMLVDMFAHAMDNPSPSTIVLISGDRDFAYAVSVLRLRRYRVVLITLATAHTSLVSQASICFDWSTDILGPSNAHSGKNLNNSFSQTRQGGNNAEPTRFSHSQEESSEDIDPVDLAQYLRARSQSRTNSFGVGTRVSGRLPEYDGPDIERPPIRTGNAQSLVLPSDSQASPPVPLHTPTNIPPRYNPVAGLSHHETGTIPTNIAGASVLEDPRMLSSKQEAVSAIPSQSHSVSSVNVNGHIGGNTFASPDVPIQSPSLRPLSQLSYSTGAFIPPQSRAPSIPSTPNHVASPLHANKGVGQQPATTMRVLAVPPKFRVLVDNLQTNRLEGRPRPLRTNVAVGIARNGATYREAGVEKFAQYIAMAEKEGIVEVGGAEGQAWISLRPPWCNSICS